MLFNNTFLNSISEDEHCLLYAILNNDRVVLYEIVYANAIILMNKLMRVPLSEEGEAIKASIVQKFKDATCIIDQEDLFISDEKPCTS